MRRAAILLAMVLTAAEAPGVAAPKASSPSATGKNLFHRRLEKGWADALAVKDAPGACVAKIGKHGARALATWCANLSTSSSPMCRPDYSCDDLTGNIWEECADSGWDPNVTRDSSRDPKHIPCANTVKREADWEHIGYRGFFGD
jgi:hypothetical protein